MTKPKPTTAQVRAARVRAAIEAYIERNKKAYKGGYLVPPSAEVYTAVAASTGESTSAVSFCATYSRSCQHSWSEGACLDCPPADHIPWE